MSFGREDWFIINEQCFQEVLGVIACARRLGFRGSCKRLGGIDINRLFILCDVWSDDRISGALVGANFMRVDTKGERLLIVPGEIVLASDEQPSVVIGVVDDSIDVA